MRWRSLPPGRPAGTRAGHCRGRDLRGRLAIPCCSIGFHGGAITHLWQSRLRKRQSGVPPWAPWGHWEFSDAMPVRKLTSRARTVVSRFGKMAGPEKKRKGGAGNEVRLQYLCQDAVLHCLGCRIAIAVSRRTCERAQQWPLCDGCGDRRGELSGRRGTASGTGVYPNVLRGQKQQRRGSAPRGHFDSGCLCARSANRIAHDSRRRRRRCFAVSCERGSLSRPGRPSASSASRSALRGAEIPMPGSSCPAGSIGQITGNIRREALRSCARRIPSRAPTQLPRHPSPPSRSAVPDR